MKRVKINIEDINFNRLKASGIYFLYQNGVLVYIGKSITLNTRIKIHLQGDKEFNQISIIKLHPKRLKSVEEALIRRHRPTYNKLVLQKKEKQKYSSYGAMFEKSKLQQITVRLDSKRLERLKALIALTKEVRGDSMSLNEAINTIFIKAIDSDDVAKEFKELLKESKGLNNKEN